MKSIIDRALEAHEGSVDEEGIEQPSLPMESDEELRKLVETLQVNITIMGCGGGGSNTIRRINEAGIIGATLVAANSDAKHLLSIQAPNKILLGRTTTRGLGAGAQPDVGRRATDEARTDVMRFIQNQDIVFITAGMGGGTGTGSAPYVAELSKRTSRLVMGIVTLPFRAEGKLRRENALKGLDLMKEFCDTTIVVENDKLLELVPKLPIEAAFRVADEVLMQSIKGITEIITKPALVNVDFNDMMTIMENGGVAMIGIGESNSSSGRVEEAVSEAMSSPLLGDIDVKSAKGALIRVVGGPDMTVSEAEKAARLIGEQINPMSRIIWGCAVEPEVEGTVKVMVVITGVKSPQFLERGAIL
jgi:cell division protein FtsZ